MADTGARAKLTYDDYLLLPEDGKQHEIIGGEHFVNSAPTPRHQRLSMRLAAQLVRQLVETARAEVYPAPTDVLFSRMDVVQPDLVVVLKGHESMVLETRLEGPPDLVVEILSPSTSARDLRLKLRLYESFGVPEYWIVEPDARLPHQHVLEARPLPPGRRARPSRERGDDPGRHGRPRQGVVRGGDLSPPESAAGWVEGRAERLERHRRARVARGRLSPAGP